MKVNISKWKGISHQEMTCTTINVQGMASNEQSDLTGTPDINVSGSYYHSSDEKLHDIPLENSTSAVVLPINDDAEQNYEDDEDDNLYDNKELFANLPSTAGSSRSLQTGNSIKKTIRRRLSKRSLTKTVNAANLGNDDASSEVGIGDVQRQQDKEDGEMDVIKSLGAPMGQRKSIRKLNLERQKSGLLRRQLGCWKLFKLRTAMSWKLFKDKTGEWLLSLQLWKNPLKEVEGNFGNGVLSYFLFLKSLFWLNIAIFLIELFIVVPQALINYEILRDKFPAKFNFTPAAQLPDYISNRSTSDLVLDFFTGQGFINTTIMFYSNYYGKIVIGKDNLTYDMPLAYIVVGGAYMIVSFFIMVHSFSKRFTESILENGDSFQSYCNKVFASWDYCITNDKAAELKKNVIYQDFIADLEEEKRLQMIKGRTKCDKFKIYMVRLACNFLVVGLLGGSVFAIFTTVKISTKEVAFGEEKNNAIAFLRRWGSSLTITALNLFLPTLFEVLTVFEEYSPHITIVMSLWRAVMLKLASVIVLITTLYEKYGGHKCNQCWENHIAAQMFNLIIVDFIVICGVTIFMETSRKYAATYMKCTIFGVALGDKIGLPEFQIPNNILDLVYGQSLIWIGTFFAPLMPVLGIVKLFIIFYVKKISLIFNCKSSSKSFQGARSNYFITLLLLLTFLMCTVAIGYGVAQVKTSKCGPYSNSDCEEEKFMISIIEKTVEEWPKWIASIITFLKTAVFLFPLFIVIFLLLYYYHAMTTAHEKMIELLQSQLKIEGRDKRFLMNRLLAVNKKMKNV